MEKGFLNKKNKNKRCLQWKSFCGSSDTSFPSKFTNTESRQILALPSPLLSCLYTILMLCPSGFPSWVSFITVLSNLKSSLSETPLTFSFVSLLVYIVAVCFQSWLLSCLGAIFSMVGFPLQLQSPRVDVKLLLNGDRVGRNICHSTSAQVRSVNVTISLHQQTLVKCMWKHGNAFPSGCLDCNPTGVYEETQSKGGNDRAKGRSWDARRNHRW